MVGKLIYKKILKFLKKPNSLHSYCTHYWRIRCSIFTIWTRHWGIKISARYYSVSASVVIGSFCFIYKLKLTGDYHSHTNYNRILTLGDELTVSGIVYFVTLAAMATLKSNEKMAAKKFLDIILSRLCQFKWHWNCNEIETLFKFIRQIGRTKYGSSTDCCKAVFWNVTSLIIMHKLYHFSIRNLIW